MNRLLLNLRNVAMGQGSRSSQCNLNLESKWARLFPPQLLSPGLRASPSLLPAVVRVPTATGFHRPQGPVQKRYFASRAITGANSSVSPAGVQVTFGDGKSSQFGSFWLRDHCKCEQCWHPTTKQRLHDTFAIPKDIKPKSSKMTADNKLEVVWPDNHVSVYDTKWLRYHAYDPKLPDAVPFVQPRAKVLWNAEKAKASPAPMVKYEDVMKTDAGLGEWLKRIDVYGYCFVDGVPVTLEDTEKLARRICFIRESHYGGFWDLTANMAHGDTAYTNLAIGAHTDSTYFTDPVGLQMFHMLKHDGEGGHTLLVDGFQLAHQMREKFPKHFEVLTTFRVPTHSAGDKDMIIQPTPNPGYPIISVHPETKEIFQIRYNNHDRSALSGKFYTKEQIEKFYDALRVWTSLVRDPKNEVWLKLQPGRAVIVDNWRVFHGRSSFTGYRRLCGAYLNWDDYRSRLAMIADGGKVKDSL